MIFDMSKPASYYAIQHVIRKTMSAFYEKKLFTDLGEISKKGAMQKL